MRPEHKVHHDKCQWVAAPRQLVRTITWTSCNVLRPQLLDMEKQQHQNPGGKGPAGGTSQGAVEGVAPKDTDLDEIREKFRIVKVRARRYGPWRGCYGQRDV